jgi:hypothetical protein
MNEADLDSYYTPFETLFEGDEGAGFEAEDELASITLSCSDGEEDATTSSSSYSPSSSSSSSSSSPVPAVAEPAEEPSLANNKRKRVTGKRYRGDDDNTAADRPAHHGEPWTAEQLQKLKDLREVDGLPWKDIAIILGRKKICCKNRYHEGIEEENPAKSGIPWTQEEDAMLIQLVEDEVRLLSYRDIGAKIGRSGGACKTRYFNLGRGKRGGAPWTLEEECQLVDMVNSGLDYETISIKLKRSDSACRVKYAKVYGSRGRDEEAKEEARRQMALAVGADGKEEEDDGEAQPWTPSLDRELIRLVEVDKQRWMIIAKQLRRKSVGHCKIRYWKLRHGLIPGAPGSTGTPAPGIAAAGVGNTPPLPSIPWSPEEIITLLRLRDDLKFKFEDIAERLNRTASACRSKYSQALNESKVSWLPEELDLIRGVTGYLPGSEPLLENIAMRLNRTITSCQDKYEELVARPAEERERTRIAKEEEAEEERELVLIAKEEEEEEEAKKKAAWNAVMNVSAEPAPAPEETPAPAPEEPAPAPEETPAPAPAETETETEEEEPGDEAETSKRARICSPPTPPPKLNLDDFRHPTSAVLTYDLLQGIPWEKRREAMFHHREFLKCISPDHPEISRCDMIIQIIDSHIL